MARRATRLEAEGDTMEYLARQETEKRVARNYGPENGVGKERWHQKAAATWMGSLCA